MRPRMDGVFVLLMVSMAARAGFTHAWGRQGDDTHPHRHSGPTRVRRRSREHRRCPDRTRSGTEGREGRRHLSPLEVRITFSDKEKRTALLAGMGWGNIYNNQVVHTHVSGGIRTMPSV